jgi:hypothetical protein
MKKTEIKSQRGGNSKFENWNSKHLARKCPLEGEKRAPETRPGGDWLAKKVEMMQSALVYGV